MSVATLLLLILVIGNLSFVSIASNVPKFDSLSNETISNPGMSVIGWQFDHLNGHLTVTVFVIFVILTKMIYHQTPALSCYIPESCILIILGIFFGLVIKHIIADNGILKNWRLNSDLFFLILLPPIILDAAFSLFNRKFAGSFVPVLIFAIIGTILNFLLVGFGLHFLSRWGGMGSPDIKISILHSLLFSSLIVAVDPVAVLAIFEDIGVDETLYYIVFGESLFNDAVTIVLYTMMTEFLQLQTTITYGDVWMGIASFFTVSLGGLLIGILIGALSCFMTRFTGHARVLEPLIIVSMGYFSYIFADLFKWSGIIAMIGCGLMQAAYAFENVSRRSLIVVKRLTKMFASISEAIIFLFLGIELIMGNLSWHTGLSLWTMTLCLISRGLVTLLLTLLVNMAHWGVRTITWTEGFVLTYGGLRGAVAFSLATLIKPNMGNLSPGFTRDEIVTTTLFVILFTVVIMGLTMKPIVRLLKIRLRAETKLSLFAELHMTIANHIMSSVEGIVGKPGRNIILSKLNYINKRYVCRLLQCKPMNNDKILKVFEKINMQMHIATTMPSADSSQNLSRIPELLRDRLLQQWQRESLIKQSGEDDGKLTDKEEKSKVRRKKWSNIMDQLRSSHEISVQEGATSTSSPAAAVESSQPIDIKAFRSMLQEPLSKSRTNRAFSNDNDLENGLTMDKVNFLAHLQTTMQAKKMFLKHRGRLASRQQSEALSQGDSSTQEQPEEEPALAESNPRGENPRSSDPKVHFNLDTITVADIELKKL